MSWRSPAGRWSRRHGGIGLPDSLTELWTVRRRVTVVAEGVSKAEDDQRNMP